MEARHGVATPPPKLGSQEAEESFVQCCGVLFARSHLFFFELRLRRKGKAPAEMVCQQRATAFSQAMT